MSLLIGIFGFAVYNDPPLGLFVVVGPWASRLNVPAQDAHEFRYANGSRWFSGWRRWQDEEPTF